MVSVRQDWQRGDINFTLMYATHDAFRRDLERFTSAAAAGRGATPGVRAGWENFKRQLHVHHSVEDNDLWPRIKARVEGRPAELALLADMEAEHGRIDPMLAAVDAAMSGRGDLLERVQELSAGLGQHLKHEEESCLPLIDEVCTVKDWDAFRGGMTRAQGFKGAMVYVPWINDAATPANHAKIMASFPPPLKVIDRLFWEPSYRKQHFWN